MTTLNPALVAEAVVETVARCYRIQDAHPLVGNRRDWDDFTSGRWHGYAQTLALFLGRPTKEVERELLARSL